MAGALVLLGALGPAAALADGSQTGLITGQVVDASGAGVAAVQVTVSGPQIRRTEVADDQGRFRFPALGVGTYDLHAELMGLVADQRGVHLSIGRTAEVRLRLLGTAAGPPQAAGSSPPPAASPGGASGATTAPIGGSGAVGGTAGGGGAAGVAGSGGVGGSAGSTGGSGGSGAPGELSSQESIQVVAETSVIDRFETRIGANLGFDFIDALPLPRAYQAVALLIPGVSDTTMDGNPNVNGALRTDNQFLIDGVDTTDPATGLFGLNLAYQAIQEVSVTTAAAPAEYGRSSGGVINVVTRSATNDFQGVTRLLASDPGWNSRYGFAGRQVAQIAPEIDAANATPNKIDPELALDLGGPLLRDRVWFFGAYDDSQSTLLGPTGQGTLWNRGAEIESSAAKATWQIDPSNTLVGQFTSDSTSFAAFNPFDRAEAENLMVGTVAPLAGLQVSPIPGDIYSLEHQTQDGRFEKLQWNSALRQDMSAEMTLADQNRDLTRQPLNSRDLTGGAPHLALPDGVAPPAGADLSADLRDAVLYNGSTDQGYEHRPRRQANLVLDGFVQLGPTDNELKAGVDFERTQSHRSFNFPGQAGIDPATGRPVAGQLFLDMNQVAGCPTCPPFDPATGTFQPYQVDQFWDRPTTLTREQTLAFYLSDAIAVERWLVSLGGRFEAVRASDSQLGSLLDSNTIAPRIAVTYDASGDRTVLLTSTYGRYYEPFLHSYLDLFSTQQLLSGYTPYTWNAASPSCAGQDPGNLASPCWVAGAPVGFARQVTGAPESDLHRSWLDEVTLGFERRITSTLGVSVNYVHRRWHDLWDDVVQGVFDGQGNLVGTTSQVQNLPDARRQQQSLQLLVQKRYADHWQLLGSYTRSRTEGNLFDDTGMDPSSFGNYSNSSDINLTNRYGLAPYDRRDQIKVLNIYRWPWQRFNLTFGSSILYESGVPTQMEEALPLGLLFLTPRGSERLGDVVQLDLALGGEVLLLQNGLAVEVKAEVFNVTDQKQILAVDPVVNSDTFGKATSILDLQTPRTYRLTLGLRF